MTAKNLLDRLAAKHSDDLFVSECKTGRTWNRAHLRFDAWAMPRSWSPWRTIGYEIKVSRSDFTSDTKLYGYVDLVHEFYVVCPWGLVDKTELDPRVGLIWASKEGSSLRIVRRAPNREIAPPLDLLIYVLMSRTVVVPPNYRAEDRAAYWRDWLSKRDEEKHLGWNVSTKVQKVLKDRVDSAAARSAEAERVARQCEKLISALKKLGLRLDDWNHETVAAAVMARAHMVDDRMARQARNLAGELHDFADRFDSRRAISQVDRSLPDRPSAGVQSDAPGDP